jgi:hypothetical protein
MSVLCEQAVDAGLGGHLDTLNVSLVINYHKVSRVSLPRLPFTDTAQISFAASLLSFFAMLGAKTSIVLLYQRIVP